MQRQIQVPVEVVRGINLEVMQTLPVAMVALV
jgi:hypothetical protein